MPTTRENLLSLVNSVLQQREQLVIERLTSTVENQMARSLEEFSVQWRLHEQPTVFNTPATSAHPLQSHQPSASTNVDPSTLSQLPTSPEVSTVVIEKVTKVPRAEYTKTSTQSSDSLAKNTITYQSQDSKKKMAHLDSILSTEYLLSLFNDNRPAPVSSTDNPYGYTPNRITIDPTTGIQTLTRADDVFHYDYDLKRSFQLLMLVFTESLHYICKTDIMATNSIAIYKAMYKHLFGKQTSDVQRENAKLDNHKVDFRMNLRQNIDVLEQLITNVEHASDRKFTNKERNQLITIKFADDTRRGHAAIFVATGVSVDDYYERISKIIQHTDDLADIHSSKPTGKIAAVVAGAPTEKCRAYSKYGNCPRGAACQYLHDPAVAPKNPKDNKDKGTKDWSKNKKPPTAAAVRPAYTVISKKHRAAVGPARGVMSMFNPEGFDDSQVLHIQQLQINAAYSVMRQAEKAGDSWLPQEPSSYASTAEPGGLYQINMMSASAPTVNTDEDEEEYEKTLIVAFDASRVDNPLSNFHTAHKLAGGLIEIEKVFHTYNRTLKEPFGSISYHNEKEGWASTLCGIVANSGPLTTFDDVKPWECAYTVPSENAIYKDLPYSPEIYGNRTQFRRKVKLTSPPPPCDADDEITEYDPPPAALHTNWKRARPPPSPTMVDLRSPVLSISS